MLVLARKVGERIVVPQCELTITVTGIHGNAVRLAFEAPAEVEVYREEVWQRRCLEMAGGPNLPGNRASSLPCIDQQSANPAPA
jgi:carbon storage regulator